MALVAAPAVTMLAPAEAFAQDFTTGTLAGTVTNTAGQPVSGATVVVTQKGRAQSRTFSTDAQGRFRACSIAGSGLRAATVRPPASGCGPGSARLTRSTP